MRRFSSVAQTFIRRTSQCDRHCAAHWALAAVHTVIGALLVAGSAMPEAACAWIVALVYALLAKFGGPDA